VLDIFRFFDFFGEEDFAIFFFVEETFFFGDPFFFVELVAFFFFGVLVLIDFGDFKLFFVEAFLFFGLESLFLEMASFLTLFLAFFEAAFASVIASRMTSIFHQGFFKSALFDIKYVSRSSTWALNFFPNTASEFALSVSAKQSIRLAKLHLFAK